MIIFYHMFFEAWVARRSANKIWIALKKVWEPLVYRYAFRKTSGSFSFGYLEIFFSWLGKFCLGVH